MSISKTSRVAAIIVAQAAMVCIALPLPMYAGNTAKSTAPSSIDQTVYLPACPFQEKCDGL